ncbi:DUF5777 family beta-barrel protein [Fodinibius sp. Rm-B-1B1-1]|uniref:DUF5777 family beta-barrel protein n=1 Tax=Fodinibius alkaliphilus TaxID=3140241 RepID=UPI00315A3A91
MNKQLWYTIVFALCLLIPVQVYAQLERERANPERDVELTFMAPRNINLYTVETLGKTELHYSIMHTFGEVRSGIQNLYGIDREANVRFSFEYGLTDHLSIGFGRSSLDKIYDFTSRINLFRQNTTNSVPVSMSLIPTLGINTTEFGFLDTPYSFIERFSYGLSLPIARKFNDQLSLQLSPMLVHFNRVGNELSIANPQNNNYYSLTLAGRYKVTPYTALSFQFIPPINDKRNPNIAVGIDIETGGHVFQMFFSTSRALNDQYLLAGDNGNFFKREFRFGFNINRLFKL